MPKDALDDTKGRWKGRRRQQQNDSEKDLQKRRVNEPDMGSIVKRAGRPRKEAVKDPGVSGVVTVGRRGRRSMPAVRIARKRFAQAQREVASTEKAVRLHSIELKIASSRNEAAQARSNLKAVAVVLKQARRDLKQVSAELRQILLVEAAKSRALAQARAIALYKSKLQNKLGKDLDKAIAKFTMAWRRRRNKIVARKLTARIRKETAKAKAASRKANAKARESVKRAEALAKARARKAAVKARVKAKKLATKLKTRKAVAKRASIRTEKRARVGKKQGKAVGKTAGKTGLGAVGTRKVVGNKRSKND